MCSLLFFYRLLRLPTIWGFYQCGYVGELRSDRSWYRDIFSNQCHCSFKLRNSPHASVSYNKLLPEIQYRRALFPRQARLGERQDTIPRPHSYTTDPRLCSRDCDTKHMVLLSNSGFDNGSLPYTHISIQYCFEVHFAEL